MSQGSVWTGTEIQEEVILMNESVIKNQGESRAGRIFGAYITEKQEGSKGKREIRGSVFSRSVDQKCGDLFLGHQTITTVVLHGEAGSRELFPSLNEAKRESGVRHSSEDQGNEDRPWRRV